MSQGPGRGASFSWQGSAHDLLARDSELAAVREHLTTGGRVTTVLGMAGAGKTSVLSAATRAAESEGWLVLSVRGRPTEQSLGFATLVDLVESGQPDGDGAGSDTGALLEQLLGDPAGSSSNALRLRRDVHQWMVALSPEQPVLVVVDDAQWVDEASWSVITFLANRLAHSEVSFLVAARSDTAPAGLTEHPVVRLPPLTAADARSLLDRGGRLLAPTVMSAVVERAAGNPLALLELARVSSAADPDGILSSAGSVSAAIEAAFAADLPGLPERTRALLLLGAAGADDLTVLHRATGTGGQILDDLEPAERAGLVRIQGNKVLFRHPLVQSTIYAAATISQRQAAHLALAETYGAGDDRRTWHRSAVTHQPDEALASELEASAQRLFARGAMQEAVAAQVRASELSADPGLRETRLLEATLMANDSGQLHRVHRLALEVRDLSTDPLTRGLAGAFLAYTAAHSMDPTWGQDLLEATLEELIAVDLQYGWASLSTLASTVYQTGRRREALAHWRNRFDAVSPPAFAAHPFHAAARLWVQAALDPLARHPELKQEILDAPQSLPEDGVYPGDYTAIAGYHMMLGATAWLLDEHPAALQHLVRAQDTMQRTGVEGQLLQTMMALGQVEFDMGLYDEADRTGRHLLDLAEAKGLAYYQCVGRELRARVAATRGDSPVALADIDNLLATLEPGQIPVLEANLFIGRANALFGLHDHEGAYEQLRRLYDIEGRPIHVQISINALGHLGSAAVRVGRADEIISIVASSQELVPDLPGERLTFVMSRVRALMAADDEANALFLAAVDASRAQLWPFEWANAQLDYGMWLRRQHRTAEARERLRSAHQLFSRLRAKAWAASAEAELRAAGVRIDRDDLRTAKWDELTAQEREIVLSAATGLTNKQIGATLFLSPRTVSTTLYRAFPKLGVTSRAQLRDVVEQVRAG